MQVKPEAKRKASEAKARGDDAFKRNDFLAAIDAYTQVHLYPLDFNSGVEITVLLIAILMNLQAIDFDPTEAVYLSNRSLCWIRMGQADHALSDARACRELRPDWAKACYREGAALRLLQVCLVSFTRNDYLT